MEFEEIQEKLFNYFKVFTIQDLAQKMNVSQPTISKWKSRNSISAVKKKCRELEIYNEIFGDLNSNGNINQGNNSRAAGRDYNENGKIGNEKESNFDDITINLIQKGIKKFGSEEEFQFQLMNFLRDK